MDKKNKSILIISIIGLFLVIAGITYAYFSAKITGVESTSTIVLTGGRMEIVYDNLSDTITVSKMYPREEAWATKNFTVTGTNTTNQSMNYRLGLDATYDFSSGYLTYSLENTNSDSGTPIGDIQSKSINNGITWFGYGQFVNGNDQEHAYTLKIYFKDNGEDQSEVMGKTFAAKVVIVEAGIGDLPVPSPEGWDGAPAGTLLAGIKANNPKPSAPLTIPGQAVSTSSEALLASTEDDYGISYYYRGAVNNNYVVFAGMCWRIVRIDGLGNIKLVLYNYNAKSVSNPCATSQDNASAAFAKYNGSTDRSEFNHNSNSNAYMGFMYGTPGSSSYEAEHANTNDSTILTNLKTWYDAKFSVSQKAQLADVIWCNDKRIVSDTTYDPWGFGNITGLGYNQEATYYQAKYRIYPYNNMTSSYDTTNASPSLKCGSSKTDNIISKFTASVSTDGGYGNGALNGYKIGLLTADEIIYAGAYYNGNNESYYLYKNSNFYSWWSLSPGIFPSTNYGYALAWYVDTNGSLLDNSAVSILSGLRPSVSLVSTVPVTTVSETNPGTASNPFVIGN